MLRTLEELDALRDECKAMVIKRAGLCAGSQCSLIWTLAWQ